MAIHSRSVRHLSTEFPEVNVAIYSAQDENLLRSVRMLAEDLGLSFAGVLTKPAGLSQITSLLERVQRGIPVNRLEATHPLTANDVREAFDNRWVASHFQPKVLLATGEPLGFEALCALHIHATARSLLYDFCLLWKRPAYNVS